MSVNNNANIPAENLFFNPDGLKNANLTENETAVLSKCNYADFKAKWQKGLNNISHKPNTHIRNTKEVKEGIFRRFGAAMGIVSYEPWKETEQIFEDWKSFDGYVRMKISSETYQKIAKANPQYFDKVIEHLEQVADNLDKRAKVRLDTFVSNQSGETLAMLASDFRSTAAFLRMKMNGGDAAKPGNNNANSVTHPANRPTVINHYHNNINIGQIGNNYIGHAGDNNFYNKNGNMGVMFQGNPSDIRHTGFKSEYSVSKPKHLFYSPTINGKKLLELTSEQALELFKHNSDKKKSFEMQRSGELTFEAQKPLPKEEPENIKQQVDSINLGSEEPQQLHETKRDLKTCYKKEEPAELQQSQAPKEAENINSVQPKQTAIENCSSKLRQLRIMFFANWDAINKDLKNGNNTKSRDTDNFKNKVQFFNKSAGNFGNEITPEKVIHEIKQLQQELNKAVEKKQSQVDGDHWSSLEPLLSGIELMLSKDKTTAEKEIKDKREKSENLSIDKQEHGIGFSKEITDEEKKNAQNLYQKQNYSANKLLKETLETIEYIREQAGLKKKKNNKPSHK